MIQEIQKPEAGSENAIKVMIIDDNMIIRKILKRVLARVGIEQAFEFKTIKEAVARIEEIRSDVVVLDVILPDVMDVLEAIPAIRYRPDLPLLMMTSASSEGMAIALKGMYGDAIDFIGKPSGREEMKAVEATGIHIAEQIKHAARFPAASLQRLNSLRVVPPSEKIEFSPEVAKKLLLDAPEDVHHHLLENTF